MAEDTEPTSCEPSPPTQTLWEHWWQWPSGATLKISRFLKAQHPYSSGAQLGTEFQSSQCCSVNHMSPRIQPWNELIFSRHWDMEEGRATHRAPEGLCPSTWISCSMAGSSLLTKVEVVRALVIEHTGMSAAGPNTQHMLITGNQHYSTDSVTGNKVGHMEHVHRWIHWRLDGRWMSMSSWGKQYCGQGNLGQNVLSMTFSLQEYISFSSLLSNCHLDSASSWLGIFGILPHMVEGVS